MTTPAKTCIACGKTVKGRIDKKFCDDGCRNNYNNQLKAETTNFMRNTINALKKNRLILSDFLGEAPKITIQKERMLGKGFQFKYHTHHYETQNGGIYVFCFEYGYLLLEGERCLIVKRDSD